MEEIFPLLESEKVQGPWFFQSLSARLLIIKDQPISSKAYTNLSSLFLLLFETWGSLVKSLDQMYLKKACGVICRVDDMKDDSSKAHVVHILALALGQQ